GQARGAASPLADSLGQRPAAEHLLVALIDQGTAEVLQTLSRAGLDPAAIRRAALAGIGAPAGQPAVSLPPLPPAGSLDRPPLPVTELDERAWRGVAPRRAPPPPCPPRPPPGRPPFPGPGCAGPGTGRPCPAWNVTRPRGWPTGSAWMKTSVTR